MLNKDDTLLNELLSDDNLKIAKQRVKKNKGASGIDGMEVKELDEYLSKHLDEIKRVLKRGGICMCFGWNTNGVGMKRGFDMEEVLVVAHGGSKNDTLCTLERKVKDG